MEDIGDRQRVGANNGRKERSEAEASRSAGKKSRPERSPFPFLSFIVVFILIPLFLFHS